MNDQRKPKAQLIEELRSLRRSVAAFERAGRAEAGETPLNERALLQILLDSVPDWIFIKDAQSRIVRSNKAHAQLLGATDPRDVVGKTDFDFFPPEVAQRFFDEEQAIIQTGQAVVARVSATPAPDAGTIWVSETKIPVKDNTGRVVGLVGISRDITDLRQATEEAKRSGQFLNNIINAIDDPIFVKDDEHRWTVLNDAACEQMGFSRQDLVGKSDHAIKSKEKADQVWERDNVVLETGTPVAFEAEITRKGSQRTVVTRTSAYTDPTTMKKYIVGTMQDVTDRKRLEQVQQRRTLQFQTATEVTEAVSSILDPEALMEQVVELVHDRFSLDYVGLFLADRDRTWAVLRAGTGTAGRQMLEKEHRLEIGGESMIGRCVANREARIALDVGEEAVRFDNPYLPETRSEMALPLISRGDAIGALTIQSAQAAAFSQDDIAILQTMASQIATAITNARLIEQTRLRAEQERLVRTITDRVRQGTDTESIIRNTLQELSRALGISHAVVRLGTQEQLLAEQGTLRPARDDGQRESFDRPGSDTPVGGVPVGRRKQTRSNPASGQNEQERDT